MTCLLQVVRYGEFALQQLYRSGGSSDKQNSPCSHFGSPEEVEVGTLWLSRVACAAAGDP